MGRVSELTPTLEDFVKATKDRLGICVEWRQNLGLAYTDRDWLDSATLGGLSVREFVHAIGSGKIDLNNIDPRILEAHQLQYPHVGDFIDFVKTQPSDAQLRGVISGLRGKLLEIEHLNLIQRTLDHGYTAELAASPTQEGWDIVVHDPQGNVIQLIQDKVNPSMALVRRFVEEHPHIDLATTQEALAHLHDAGLDRHLLDTGVAIHDLDIVDSAVEHVSQAAVIAYEIPYLGLLAIAASEGYAVGKKRTRKAELLARVWFRTKRLLAANGAAQALYWMTGEPMLLLTASLFRTAITRWDVSNGFVRRTNARRERIQKLAVMLNEKTPEGRREVRTAAFVALAFSHQSQHRRSP